MFISVCSKKRPVAFRDNLAHDAHMKGDRMRALGIGSAAEVCIVKVSGKPDAPVWTAAFQPSVSKADPCVHVLCLYIYPSP